MDYKISDAMNVPLDLDAMKSCLAEGYPIVFALKLTKQFFTPDERGYIPTPDPEDPQAAKHGWHTMLLVGYSDRQEVFIVRNSWGTEWGDEGYGYVPYDYIANEAFNDAPAGGQYAIKALTEYDLTPDDDDGEDLPGYDEDMDGGETPVIEAEEEDDEEDEEDEDFDPENMFSAEAEMMRAFYSFDEDGNGYIDKKEITQVLLRCGHSQSAINGMIEDAFVYDEDESGTLSYEEFRAFM